MIAFVIVGAMIVVLSIVAAWRDGYSAGYVAAELDAEDIDAAYDSLIFHGHETPRAPCPFSLESDHENGHEKGHRTG